MDLNRRGGFAPVLARKFMLTLLASAVPAIVTAAAPAASQRACPGSPAPACLERAAYLMGTRLRIRVGAPDRGRAIAATEAAFAEVRRLEALLTTWESGSELSRLNAAPPGASVSLDSDLLHLLSEAAVWSRRTGGAFDPAVGPLIDAWDLRGEGRVPSPAERERTVSATGLDHFELDLAAGMASRNVGTAWLDAGGFGKGAALRAARATLEAKGVEWALLDFGGQVLAIGEAEVAVAHPVHRRRAAAVLRLRDMSAATSSASERFIEVDGRRFGHVLDPRTGMPVPAWGSVTVVAEDALAADALSTALFVLGPDEGLAWADHNDVAALFLVGGHASEHGDAAAAGGDRADGHIRPRWTDALDPLLVCVGRSLNNWRAAARRGRTSLQNQKGHTDLCEISTLP